LKRRTVPAILRCVITTKNYITSIGVVKALDHIAAAVPSTPESLRGEKAKDNSGILLFTIFYSLPLGYEFSGLFSRF
jgi:hypothetical protein